MTDKEAKKILESYFDLTVRVIACDHVIYDVIGRFRDLRPSIREFYDRTVLDKEAYLQEQERIRSAINRIPDEMHSTLLRLRFIERKKWPEVAEALWLSDASCAIRKARKSYSLFAKEYDG